MAKARFEKWAHQSLTRISLKLRRAGFNRTETGIKLKTAQQGGDIHLVRAQELTRFLLNHPDEYELGPVEKFWFLDAISGGRLCQEYRGEVA